MRERTRLTNSPRRSTSRRPGARTSCSIRKMTAHQGAILTTLERWYRPVEILKMATAVNGELLAMSGPRNPYPGKLGVIEEGALADLILVDGDPTRQSQAHRRSGQEFPRHHEGRAGGQGRSPGARVVTGRSLPYRERCREVPALQLVCKNRCEKPNDLSWFQQNSLPGRTGNIFRRAGNSNSLLDRKQGYFALEARSLR